MEVDERLLWLISALKAADEPSGVNKEKLLKNVSSCFLRIKKETRAFSVSSSPSAKELQDFQVKAAVLLLLCLPSIRELPQVKNSAEFESLISSLPELSNNIFFAVVRTQKIYFLLSPLVSWLPPAVVQTLCIEFFHNTTEVTPITLAITVELLKAQLFTAHHCYTSHENSLGYKECLNLLVEFLSLKTVSEETLATVKISGYLCMYLFECLHLLLSAYVGSMWTPATFSCVKVWTNLWHKDMGNKDTFIFCLRESIKTNIKSVLMLCQKSNSDVTVHMWMGWSDVILPLTYEVHIRSNQCGRGWRKSIQLVICNIAFDVLRMLEAHPWLRKELDTSACQELLQFFHQVAVDPDHDPDQDLSLQQLLEQIHLKDERQEKLLSFLVQNDEVFTNDAACSCLREHAAVVNTQTKLRLLERCIEWIKAEKTFNTELRNVALDLAADLSPEHLLPLLECSLSAGLDDTLKTPSFRSQLTAVLNQLADKSSAQPSGRHVWLCLQCGRGVVEEAVQLAVTMTGLVPVMVKVLADIPPVCHAVLPSGYTLLVASLLKWQTSTLCEQEQQEFMTLVKHLLSEQGVLEADEVMQVMVEPFLTIEGCSDLDKLILPIEILEAVMMQDVRAVLVSGPRVVSLALTLTHVLDSTVCLEGQVASVLLSLRSLASTTLIRMTNAMVNSNKKFEKETNILQLMMGKYNLHPLSVVCLSEVLDAEFSGDRHPDLVLQALVKVSSDLHEGSAHIPGPVFARLQRMSRSDWITSLLQLLVHCSKCEWTAAFFLTDCAFACHSSQPAINVVFELFEAVAYLVCEILAHIPTHKASASSTQEPECPATRLPLVSLHHFFMFFSSAGMIYLEVKTQTQSPRERFCKYADLFQWWCCTIPSLFCNAEFSTLFLARLWAAMEELVASGRLKVVSGEHTKLGSGCQANATMNQDETNSLTGTCISKFSLQTSGVDERESESASSVCAASNAIIQAQKNGNREEERENQRFTGQRSECTALSVCESKRKSESSSTKHVISKTIVQSKEDAHNENQDIKKRQKEIIDKESEPHSEKNCNKDIIQTRDKTAKENPDHIGLIETAEQVDVCANCREGNYVSKTSVLQARVDTENYPDHMTQKEADGKKHGKADGSFRVKERSITTVSYISARAFMEELECMTVCMAKYVPSSNLLATIAGKMKKYIS